ncbi:homeobox-domain-containing protein [Chrysochromulina tobinii]|uniref:Homeobox-domain-containing protein n=1 Tax=Chrysochromulina tobinii TaxID=1460289 RepID=A0A0M0JUL2_9EUKA|nr:homeobox-domain-containing protein [Chrysochromulina tobinii]|eukprot:KOO29813.1 homeobox-domain-containing protein [Chrysochromulina sp. CCMP291]
MASRADPAVEVAAVVTDESDTLIHDVVDDDTALVVVPATMDDAAATSESNQRKKVNQRWVLSDEAKRALEAVYNERRFPTLAMREELAQELGGSLRQVQVWFQNRRQRDHRPDDEATLSTGASPPIGSSAVSGTRAPAPASTGAVSGAPSAPVQPFDPLPSVAPSSSALPTLPALPTLGTALGTAAGALASGAVSGMDHLAGAPALTPSVLRRIS